jgi:hypothetical protein
MVTYKAIQADVRKRSGRFVKTCWIAHVKELNGLPMRIAPNRRTASCRAYPCPHWARPLIEDTMRRKGAL